ncbi:restriction endonuclease subunit S [Brevibacillus porteri]|uniref:restriction endonuclease subunit S n=1 Tax=Brevibacillus porteri TaxID=2126350 RepID=UPI003D212F76
MSKTKKTIEELLEEALVPEEEQPYEVPENWVWTKIGHVFKQAKEQVQPTRDEIYVGLEHIAKGGGILEVGNSEEVKSKKVIFNKHDVLYGKLRPYLNKHAYVEFEGVASTDILVFRNKNKITNKLLDMYLGLPHVIQYANENSNGINLPRVSPLAMDNMVFPLPPLKEQKRIADKVERFLNKIEEAKELIEEVKQTFELRRAAILDKAFRGELTRKWREENNKILFAKERILEAHLRRTNLKSIKKEFFNDSIKNAIQHNPKLPDGWVVCEVGFLCDCIVPGRDKPKSFTGDIPWVTIPDIVADELGDNQSGLYLSEQEIREVNAKIIPENSVIMSCVGRFGISAVVTKTMVINQQLHAFLPSELILPKYLMYHIRILKKYMDTIATSTTVSYLNKNNANSLPINLPTIEEQEVIVKTVDSLLNKLEAEYALINETDVYLENLKQSILSKAFRGELGTNDPTEESAIELLKEVLQEQGK